MKELTADQLNHLDELREMTMQELVAEFISMKKEIERDKENLSMKTQMFDILRKTVMVDKMEDNGLSNANFSGLGRVSLRAELYATIIKERKEEAYEWLVENEFGDLIKETVNSSTFKAFCKEQMEAGTILPEELFKISPYTMATVTKG